MVRRKVNRRAQNRNVRHPCDTVGRTLVGLLSKSTTDLYRTSLLRCQELLSTGDLPGG